jgi:PEP-CTERM/exosortase A-associated glycosyltransferase
VAQNWNMLKMAHRICDKYNPDLIHSHSPFTCGITGNRVAGKRGIPSIYEMRGLWEESHASRKGLASESIRYRMIRSLDNMALRGADLCLAIGNGLKQEIISRGIPAHRVDVIPNGVNMDDFAPGPADPELRAALDLEGCVVFGYIGSFFRFEGLMTLVEALSLLGDEFNNLKLLLVGDGELTPELRLMAQKEGVEDKVVFTGRVPHDQIAKYYKLFDIMVLPRVQTRLTTLVTPLKPLEIMAMEKPLLASDIGGHREMVIPLVNGMLFNSEDARDLAQKMRDLINDPNTRDQLAASARKWVEENRSWSALGKRYLEIYQKLVSTNPPPRY